MTTPNQTGFGRESGSGGAYHSAPSPPIAGDLIAEMWRRKVFIIAISLVCALAATVLAFTVDDKFQASVVLSPVSEESNGGRLGGLAALASTLGGLGSIGLSSPGNTQKSESIATLQSEALTDRYIKENNLLPILYDKMWDSGKQAWKDVSPEDKPTLWKANQYFRRHVRSLTSDTKTGLSTLTITWKNPVQAAEWANGIVRMTNDYLRTKAMAESELNIAYLKDQLAKTSVIGVQSAINSLLENEMNKMMMAQGSPEYALKVIDPAVVPEKRSSPVPVLWIAMGLLLGLTGSGLFVFVRYSRPIRLVIRQDAPAL